jgi:hypothetical protein
VFSGELPQLQEISGKLSRQKSGVLTNLHGVAMALMATSLDNPMRTVFVASRARAICRTLARGVPAAVAFALMAGHAAAMDVPDDEYPKLKQCEARLCTMILKKEPAGEDLSCKLSKTWAQDTIKGGESKTVRWGFGDARCALNFSLARSEIMSALTQPDYTLNIPSHAVKCEVDRSGELKPVTAKLAPKIIFKNGRAEKVWINLTDLSGPADIKSTVWTAANMEDTLGIFHGSMIKQINKFMYTKCKALYGPAAVAKALKKLNAEKRRSAAAALKAKKAEAAAPAPAAEVPVPKTDAPAAAAAPAEAASTEPKVAPAPTP